MVNLPLVAADYYDYPYVATDITTITTPYETDMAKDKVGFGHGIPTRNPEHIFKETKNLIEASGTPQSRATRYYLSKRFQDLQEKEGQYWHEVSFRYIHAINALRHDLHTQENIVRIVSQITRNEVLSEAQKQTSIDIQKDMFSLAQNPQNPFRPRMLEKIKTIIRILNPSAEAVPVRTYASAATAAPTITVEEDAFSEQRERTHRSILVDRGTTRPASPTTTARVNFAGFVERARFQATREELYSMHGTSLDLQKAKEAELRGAIVRSGSPIRERMQQGSLATLNDLPPVSPTTQDETNPKKSEGKSA